MEKSKTEIVTMQSALLGREVRYYAITPKGYSDSPNKFPVLYLLHGLFGRFDNWITNTKIVEYAQDCPFLIICPEGSNSWYTDTQNLKNHFYESYIFKELMPHVEQKYQVCTDKDSRAIAGLSMGGYGAFKFSFRHPEMFCFAASMSGAFHAAGIFDNGENRIWQHLYPSIMEVFGREDKNLRDENDLLQIAQNFPNEKVSELPFFYFDCGVEDSFLIINKQLDEIFSQKQIPHEFYQFPGGHDWGYWDSRITHVLKLATMKFMAQL